MLPAFPDVYDVCVIYFVVWVAHGAYVGFESGCHGNVVMWLCCL
jgi:hypothetical protein